MSDGSLPDPLSEMESTESPSETSPAIKSSMLDEVVSQLKFPSEEIEDNPIPVDLSKPISEETRIATEVEPSDLDMNDTELSNDESEGSVEEAVSDPSIETPSLDAILMESSAEPEVEPLSTPQQAPIIGDLIAKAEQYLADGRHKDALETVVQSLTDNVANPKALYLYAKLTDDKDNAIQALKNALQLQPGFFEARLLLERLQASIGGASPASSSAQDSIASSPAATPSPPAPSASSESLTQQMLAQHQMLMQQQMINQQQFTQQQMLNQQQLAQQQLMQSRGAIIIESNGIAFWLGVIAALFGFFGIAHMINGKIGEGIVYLLLGFVWDAIAATLIATIAGACVAIPLHLIFAYYNAKNGAKGMQAVGTTTIRF